MDYLLDNPFNLIYFKKKIRWGDLVKASVIIAGLVCISSVNGTIVSAWANDITIENCYNYSKIQDYPKAVENGKKAVNKLPKSFDAHYCLGSVYENTGQYNLAINELKLAEKYTDNPKQIGLLTNFLGLSYFGIGDYEESFRQHNKALILYRGLNDKANVSVALSNLAGIYLAQKKFEKALEYYKEAVDIAPDKSKTYVTYGNIATVYSELNNREASETNLNKAIQLCEQAGDFHELTLLTIKLGISQIDIEQYAIAEKLILDALKQAQKLADVSLEASALQWLGIVNLKMNKKTIALDYSKKALSLFNRIGAKVDAEKSQYLIDSINTM